MQKGKNIGKQKTNRQVRKMLNYYTSHIPPPKKRGGDLFLFFVLILHAILEEKGIFASWFATANLSCPKSDPAGVVYKSWRDIFLFPLSVLWKRRRRIGRTAVANFDNSELQERQPLQVFTSVKFQTTTLGDSYFCNDFFGYPIPHIQNHPPMCTYNNQFRHFPTTHCFPSFPSPFVLHLRFDKLSSPISGRDAMLRENADSQKKIFENAIHSTFISERQMFCSGNCGIAALKFPTESQIKVFPSLQSDFLDLFLRSFFLRFWHNCRSQ